MQCNVEKQHTEQTIDNGRNTGQRLRGQTDNLHEFIALSGIFDHVDCRPHTKWHGKQQRDHNHLHRVDDGGEHGHVVRIIM